MRPQAGFEAGRSKEEMLHLLCHAEDNSFGVSIDTPSFHQLPHVDVETEVESQSRVLSQLFGAILKAPNGAFSVGIWGL